MFANTYYFFSEIFLTMPPSTLFKLTKSSIEDISVRLDQLTHDYRLSANPDFTPSKYVQDETGLKRDMYNSLRKKDNEWRTRKVIDSVAAALQKKPHEIVLIVKEGEDFISPAEYFGVVDTQESSTSRVVERLSEAKEHERHFIEAVISLLQEPEFSYSRPRLVSLATGGYGIRKIELGLSNDEIIKISRKRPKEKGVKGRGLVSSSGAGFISAAYMQKLDLAISEGNRVQVPATVLYDLAFSLNVLPSSLIDRDTDEYLAFSKSESEIANKLTNAQ